MLDLNELKQERAKYEAQKQQHLHSFHQLLGAITVLDVQIAKLEKVNADTDNETKKEAAEV